VFILHWLRSQDEKNKTDCAENSTDRNAKSGKAIFVNNTEWAQRNIPQLSSVASQHVAYETWGERTANWVTSCVLTLHQTLVNTTPCGLFRS